MTTLYIEPFSGLSGDMLLSALCGLTDAYEEITSLPEKLHLTDGKVEVREVNKNGIVCKHVKIIDLSDDQAHSGHHHHSHDHDHHHHHSHDHDHGHHHHHEGHRHLKDILKIIQNGHISEGAKQIARDIFTIIGRSEAKIHNIPLEKIHFHEVSGVDSILDIVGCAVLLDRLQVRKTFSDPVCTGYGMVKTQHGLLPVPAPATADILRGLPTYKGNEAGEKVTPTGAAILRYLNPDFQPSVLQTEKIAYGPGEKDFQNPNVVRVSVVRSVEPSKRQNQMYVIETNIDDTSSEYLGADFQADLLSSGATDFFFTPVQMKKGRPGLQLSVLTQLGQLKQTSAFILENTSTIGLRYYPVSREILDRRAYEVETPYGKIRVKEVTKPSGRKSRKIEYDSLRSLSTTHNMPVPQLEEKLYAFLDKKI